MPGDEDECLVCGSVPHGVHFGVFSCRACAAFFRRTLAIGKSYTCRRGTKNCPVSKGIKNICRHCRYQKCKRVGMSFNEGAEQLSPSSSSSPASNQNGPLSPACQSPKCALDLPEMVISNNKVLYDFTPLIHIITNTLNGEWIKVGSDDNLRHPPLLNLQYAYRFIDPELFASPILQQVDKVDMKVVIREIEHFFIRLAKFAMCSREFAALPSADKWNLYRRAAIVMFYSVKPFWSMKKFGTDLNDRRFAFGDTWFIDVHNFDYSAAEFSQKTADETNRLFKPLIALMFKTVLTPMRRLNLTEKELMFLLANLLWNIREGSELSAETMQTAERYMDELASNLHDYYVYEMRMDSYAVRLTKIVKLLANFEGFTKRQEEIVHLAEMFDIINCPMFAPGMF